MFLCVFVGCVGEEEGKEKSFRLRGSKVICDLGTASASCCL